LFSALAACGALVAGVAGTTVARESSHAQIERGRYLARAGDCEACHTDDKGKPFAGGRPVPTPFGTIYATNITPDRETGIGQWSDAQFWNAMHDGIRPGGQHLYPAFPYPWFTRLSGEDVLAIRAYLETVQPVHQENKVPGLPWYLDWRGSVAVWNALFFKDGTYVPDPGKSAQWNRGAYLVEGLGHCGACHSPKNVLGSVKKADRFQGGTGEGWFATSLTKNAREGLGAWSAKDIVEYLKTGANDRARAMGPMAEVVRHSTMHLSDDDLYAIAAYLKDMPGDDGTKPAQTTASNDTGALGRGKLLYADQCAACHMADGSGVPGVFPPIKGNTGLHAHDPQSLARLVLEGAHSARTPEKPEGFAMPGFADKLSDAEVADLLTYIRASFGNRASSVTANQVADVRKQVSEGK
jgi:mono/diheme cytochrome c family protein